MWVKFLKVFVFFLWFPIWGALQFSSKLSDAIKGFSSHHDSDGATDKALTMTEPGDIVLVSRSYPAPWGDWSHAGLVISTDNDGAIVHATTRGVVKVPFNFRTFLNKPQLAILRVKGSREQRDAAVKFACKQVGKPFTFFNFNPKKQNAPRGFCCSSLIGYAYKNAAGIDFSVGRWILPDHLFKSAKANLIYHRSNQVIDTESPHLTSKKVFTRLSRILLSHVRNLESFIRRTP